MITLTSTRTKRKVSINVEDLIMVEETEDGKTSLNFRKNEANVPIISSFIVEEDHFSVVNKINEGKKQRGFFDNH